VLHRQAGGGHGQAWHLSSYRVQPRSILSCPPAHNRSHCGGAGRSHE
jgi:hypothetical protein